MKNSRFWRLLGSAVLGAGAALFIQRGAPALSGASDQGAGHREAQSAAVDDPVALATGAALSVSSLRDFPKLLARLEKLDATQLTAVLTKVADAPPQLREKMLPALLGWWAVRDLEAATEWFRPELERMGKLTEIFINDQTYAGLLDAWVEAAPDSALEFARRFAGRGLAKSILEQLLVGVEFKDYRGFFETLQSFPDARQRAEVTKGLLVEWAESDAPAALSLATTLPEGEARRDILAGIFYEGARRSAQRFELLDRAVALGVEEHVSFPRILGMAAHVDPAGTARWLELQDGEFLARHARYLLERWLQADPAAALEWADQFGVSLLEPAGLGLRMGESLEDPLREMGNLFANVGDNAALDWLAKKPPGAERDRYVRLAMQLRYPFEKLRPLLDLLPEEDRSQAAYQLAKGGEERDEAVVAGVRKFPAGPPRAEAWAGLASHVSPWASEQDQFLQAQAKDFTAEDRDAVLAEFARKFAEVDAEESLALPLRRALEIQNPALRRQTFDDVMATAATVPAWREMARRRLATLAVPEEWKSPWRAALKAAQ